MQPVGPDEAGRTTRQERLIERLLEMSQGAAASRTAVRVVRAPGRVNLIGEHTDYNLGFVMPAAIDLETVIASTPRPDGIVRAMSLQEGAVAEFDLAAIGPASETWVDYVAGTAKELMSQGIALRGVDAVVDSEIPIGAGLSSSAALELAAAWTLTEDTPPPLPAMELARLAQRAENEYVGVKSGLMDQFASSHGQCRFRSAIRLPVAPVRARSATSWIHACRDRHALAPQAGHVRVQRTTRAV